MRVHPSLTMSALLVGLVAGAAQAQGTGTTETTTTTTTQTSIVPESTTQPPTSARFDSVSGNWFIAGFAGGNFGEGNDVDGTSADFGGALGWLFHRWVGAELLVGFTPKFQIGNAFLAKAPQVNTYMGNVTAAIPIGDEHTFQPFVSAGLGGIESRATVFDVVGVPEAGTTSSNQTRFGGNIGGGFMVYAGHVGLRTDVRYFRAFESAVTDTGNTADVVNQNLLSNLDFWRANVGLAIRW